jgi:hypothetical protein
MGHDVRMSPLTHLQVERSTSVYVSDGRFAEALILFFILTVGTCGYLMMHSSRGRKIALPTVGVVALATVMGGVRHAFISMLVSSIVLIAAMLWGSGRRVNELFRIGKAIRLVTVFAAAAVVFMILLFPDAIKARWALYTETLTPGTATSDLGYRAWEYPVANLASVFTQPNWQFGNGIGTASLGTQYVSRLIGGRPPELGSESGYGGLILEFGIVGPVLWLLWTSSLLICAWRVVRKLKKTSLFPIGFALFWYAVYILALGIFYGLAIYQNYLSNAYLWLTLGMLFRLPGLLAQQRPPAAPAPAYATPRA